MRWSIEASDFACRSAAVIELESLKEELEVIGLQDCIKGCEDSDLSSATTMDELVTMTKDFVHQRLGRHGYVPAVYRLIAMRIEKVAAYLSVDANASVV